MQAMKQAMYKIQSFMPNSQNKTDYNDMHNISKKRNNENKQRENGYNVSEFTLFYKLIPKVIFQC